MDNYLTQAKMLLMTIYVTIGAVLAWIGIDKEIFIVYGVLLLIDYSTGLLKAYRLGESIKSNIMKYGILSKLILILIPLTLALVGKIVGANYNFLLVMSMHILALSELYSIISNVYSYRTKEELPEIDALRILAKNLREWLIKKDANDKG